LPDQNFLVDVNLPFHISVWNDTKFQHVKGLNESWKDSEIWLYAKKHDLIIITKDADFSALFLSNGAPPKIIHIRIGNLRMSDFHSFISKFWPEIEIAINDVNLLNVYLDRIEGIK